MNYQNKTLKDLILICKENKIKGYTSKKKEEIIKLLNDNKKNKGQYYTTNSNYILDGFNIPFNEINNIIEPFAGQGDLIKWIKTYNNDIPITAYDIEPKCDYIIKQDTLLNPPDYNNSFIITNPPFLARNKSNNKEIYDLYNTNDLYKCFIESVVKQNNCKGGIFIIPAGFFFSNRDIDIKCRDNFMKNYKIIKIKYFEETVFNDTSTTIVAFLFEKSNKILEEQNVLWEKMPTKEEKIFTMSKLNNWIIGGDIYNLQINTKINIRRHVEGKELKENEQLTNITLNALDSGTQKGRINLSYIKDYVYPAKECSRTYATLCITGKILTELEQIELCLKFNEFIEKKRLETWSLFLPQFRESKEYARKRIPFELVYNIILHLLQTSN